MDTCFSKVDFERFLNESLPTEQLSHWRQHLRGCDRCAGYLAQLRIGRVQSQAQVCSETISSPEKTAVQIGLEPNVQIGDFRIEKRIGTGGMGIVYQAHQISLNRPVALKVLTFNMSANASAIERFGREAQAAAKLQNPNIISIHAEGVQNGICYYAMELVKGYTLEQLIKHQRNVQPPSSQPQEAGDINKKLSDAARSLFPSDASATAFSAGRFDPIANALIDVAEAMDYAHQNGVIHRDIKPANLMVAEDGRLMVMDFGIARMINQQAMTVTHSFMGTPLYMSPEQIRGNSKTLDHRTDIYSLGITLYELITLRPIFEGVETQEQVITHILNKTPQRPRQINKHIPADLETICLKAIETNADRRYQSAGELADDLRRFVNRQVIKAKPAGPTDRLAKLISRHKLPSTLVGGMCLVILIAIMFGWENTQRSKVQKLIPQLTQMIEQESYFDAYIAANKVKQLSPAEPMLEDIWPKISGTFTIMTDPPQAMIYFKDDFAENNNWVELGQSPLEEIKIPLGAYRWKIVKQGYETVECARKSSLSPQKETKTISFKLHEKGTFPSDMIWIPPSELKQNNLFHGQQNIPNAPAFLIDKYEVTNRKFKVFIDAGGYENPAYWQEQFVKDGRNLSFDEAIKLFIDSSNHLGPATWINGTYPEDQAEYPVGGISWYEAAAYAKFRNKDLPTSYHWHLSTIENNLEFRVCGLSNFSGQSAKIADYPGIGQFGLYDTAGNVREWCYNSLEGKTDVRAILGGAWNDPTYVFKDGQALSPWNREITNGFRCVKYLGGKEQVPQVAFAPLENKHRDLANFTPFSEKDFRIYAETLYRYEPLPLNAKIESTDYDLEYCRRERISFDAAYPEERVIAFLHLPENAKPPYQVVIWFPGGGASDVEWDRSSPYRKELVSIIQNGRAVILPMYKGFYDRRIQKSYDRTYGLFVRDLYIKKSQDLRRSIDYLETREDINTDKIGYAGFSLGAHAGCIMLALEERIKTGILMHGGICGCKREPTSDCANFAAHVKQPVLMMNSRYDRHFPYESAQKPMFDFLGTPAKDKKHALFDAGGHGAPWQHRKAYYQTINDWLDTYLGPVEFTENGTGSSTK